jgi:hypothetical protein
MRTPPLTVIARSPCDEAIQGPRAVTPGLLRCARNDGGVDATIIGHRLCQTTSCRDSIPVSRLFNALQAGKFPPAIFGASHPSMAMQPTSGRARASVGRRVAAGGRDSFRVSRFINALQAGKFPSRATMKFSSELLVRPTLCRSERPVRRAPVYHILWLRGFRDHTISGPGFNLFKSLRRHFRATPSVADDGRFGTRRCASIGKGVAHRAKPQRRSSSAIGAIIMGMGRSRHATAVWSARGPRGTGSLKAQGHRQARSRERPSVTIT